MVANAGGGGGFVHCKRPWQRSAGRRCGGGYELELAIRCPRSVSRGDTVPDRDRELRAGCCRKRLRRPASCWREDSGEEQKRLGIRGNPGPSSFGSCGVDESAVDHSREAVQLMVAYTDPRFLNERGWSDWTLPPEMIERLSGIVAEVRGARFIVGNSASDQRLFRRHQAYVFDGSGRLELPVRASTY